ncbi:MAG: hypothetical protein IPO27_11650 [Bacteroidetes bacterium]|nr:hypothetical protein [Bacteroidota bacterium]
MRFIVVALLFCFSFSVMAQTEKIKAGIIRYDIKYSNASGIATTVSQLPVKCELIFNEKEYRTVMKTNVIAS